MPDGQASKRELLKKAAYVAPAILTLKVAPSFASSGSGRTEEQGSGFAESEEYKDKSNNGADKHQKSKRKD